MIFAVDYRDSAAAAASPPKPTPTITTRVNPFDPVSVSSRIWLDLVKYMELKSVLDSRHSRTFARPDVLHSELWSILVRSTIRRSHGLHAQDRDNPIT